MRTGRYSPHIPANSYDGRASAIVRPTTVGEIRVLTTTPVREPAETHITVA